MEQTQYADIKAAIDKVGKAHQDYRNTNDERLVQLEKGNESRAKDLDAQLAKIDKALDEALKEKRSADVDIADMQERIEELEAIESSPKRKAIQAMRDEHVELFEKAIRSRFENAEVNLALKNHESKLREKKDITIGTPAAGGHGVPEQIARDIEKLERKISPVRDTIKVVPVGTSDYKELVSIGGTTSGWVGETGTRSATATPQLRERAPTHGELYAYPQASEWSLDDIFFDVGAWLQEEVAEEFAIQEEAAVLTGNGTNKPTGMLATAPTADADDASPLRAAGAYQFVPSAASPDAITADSLITLVYTVNRRYRALGSWIMNSLTTAAIRKLKDGQNQYLWAPGLQPGEPDRLLGYSHRVWEQMADVGANAHVAAFGNFRRAYVLSEIRGMRITTENVTNPGFVRYYIRRREGGTVLNNDAIKWLKTT